MCDFATLTGAARVALGTAVPAYFCNDQGVAAKLESSSSKVKDPLWRMPLYENYKRRLKSKVADLRNVPSDGGLGGAITAALYLQNFVSTSSKNGEEGSEDDKGKGEEVKWVHIDLNGSGGDGMGEAQGMRAVLDLISGLSTEGKTIL